MILKLLVRHSLLLVLAIVLGGLAGATLVRFAPGFDSDDAQLDAGRSAESIEALRVGHAQERQIVSYYGTYLKNLARGELGESHTFRRPVRELLSERVGATWDFVSIGLLAGCGFGLLFAVAALYSNALDNLCSLLSGVFLSVPAAIAAIAALVIEAPVWICLAAVIFPRVFRYTRDLLSEAAAAPHVLAARGRGVGPFGVMTRHILPTAMPQTMALLGIMVSTAMAADIPVEVLAGIPGIGQLAWQAASARDLPVLVSMTMLLGAIAILANALADLGAHAWRTSRA